MITRIKLYSLLIILLFGLSHLSISDASLAAMSIDFGSQFLKMALVKPGMPMEIVINKEARRKTPNLLTIKNDELFFGDAALSASLKNPKNSFTHIVDLIGKKIDNPIVSLYKQRFPFMEISADETRDVPLFTVDNEKYNMETIVAMILNQARSLVEEFANQTVKDAVITVPVFFNQAERRAVVHAAEIAGLNLLQLMNDHVAVGLNFAVFHSKKISEAPRTLMIYDVGASKVTATILEFTLATIGNEKNPTITTLGVGYNRAIGGLEITVRLRDHLINEFRNHKKTRVDVTKNPRAMAKFLNEAERVKIVLSANANCMAQIENVHEDHDFSVHVTREQLERMIDDLEVEFMKPISDALKLAELNVDQIGQVVLMGAGTRVPKVQGMLQKLFKGMELGRFLNTDESIAMGAVFQAAHLSKGFKVKKFVIRDLQIFPIQIDFTSVVAREDHIVHRPIFGFKSFIPASKKILSFSSFTSDFSINMNYGDVKQLSESQLKEFGSLNISDISLAGITDAYNVETAKKDTTFKGVKIHFAMDGSGIVHISGAEVLVERPAKSESAFASLAGKITGLFSGSAKEEIENNANDTEKNEAVPDKTTEDIELDKSTINYMENLTEKVAASANKTSTNLNETKKEEEKPQLTKLPLKLTEKRLDVLSMSDSEITAAKARLNFFHQKGKEKAQRDAAHNALESLAYDTTDKLSMSEFLAFMTDDERLLMEEELKKIKAWLEDSVDWKTSVDQFSENRKELDKILSSITTRIKEDEKRPQVVAELMSMFNHTETFLLLSKNFTQSEIFTQVEIETLSKLLDETKVWLSEKVELQNKLKLSDPPAFTVSDANEKLYQLNRGVSYLLNKMKFSKPKIAKKERKANETGDVEDGDKILTDGDDAKSSNTDSEKVVLMEEEKLEKNNQTIEVSEDANDYSEKSEL